MCNCIQCTCVYTIHVYNEQYQMLLFNFKSSLLKLQIYEYKMFGINELNWNSIILIGYSSMLFSRVICTKYLWIQLTLYWDNTDIFLSVHKMCRVINGIILIVNMAVIHKITCGYVNKVNYLKYI
jgi:hypothetical protein